MLEMIVPRAIPLAKVDGSADLENPVDHVWCGNCYRIQIGADRPIWFSNVPR